MRYEDASGAFQASGPVANDDSDTLAAGSRGPATGNLITGEGTQYGSAGADSAAGAHVSAIAGKGGEDSSFAGGKLSVAGEFGHLSVDAEGNYSYMANKGAPENVRDRFTYTLADNAGNSDTAALIVEIGKTPVVIKADAQQIVPGPDGVVTLPPGVELSDIMVVGRNLVINMPDGTQLIIVDGAVFVPQLSLGGVEVPASNVAALLIGQEPQPAAGETPPSSGGNFALPPPPLDPGVPLGDLIPPTVRDYIPPAPQETFFPEDDEPEIFVQPDGQPATVNAVDQVEEAGLPERDGNLPDEPPGSAESADGNGADNDVNSETTTGNIIYTSDDTPNVITLNGVAITSVGQVFHGDFGDLTITSIAPGIIGYRYTLDDNTSGNDTHDDFAVQLVDADGDIASATLRIDIIDDVPTARPDTDALGVGEFIATGNVMTDASLGDLGDSDTNAADTVGADNARVTFIDSVDAAPGASVPEVGFVDIAGQFGTLRIFANGDYVYTRGPNSPGGVQDAFNYTLTDGDGDTSTTTLTISIPDTPISILFGNAVSLDDDALSGGNPGGPGDDDPDTSNTEGDLNISGGDGALTFSLLTSGAPAGFTYVAGPGGSLLIQQGGVTVITVTLDPATGHYTVTQNAPIDHPSLDGQAGDNTENNIVFDVTVRVTDADGDTADAVGQIIVDDDTPIAVQAVVTGNVDEDGVLEGADDNGAGDGIAGGTGDIAGEDTVATGSVAAMFSAGADTPLSYGFAANAIAVLEGLGLTSNGLALDYAIVGNTVTASTAAGDVFTFELNAGGSWEFTLIDQLDHAEGNAENDLVINLGNIIEATDADGDSVVGNANGLQITVDDDTPTASGAQVTGLVDEDGVVEGAADSGDGDGIAGGIGDVAGEDTVAIGNVSSMFNTGADAPLSFGFAANTVAVLTGLGLTSGGDALDYAILGNTVTASTAAGDVFTFELNADGSWEFTLIDQLDHAPGNNENDLSINLGAIIEATDADGDSVVGNANGLVITVDDDTPVARNDVDSVPAGGDIITGNVVTGANTDTGAAGSDDTGADEPASVTGLSSNNTDDVDNDPAGGGFIVDGEFGQLTMQSDGSYSYDRFPGSPGSVADVFTYTYTDADGDSVTATLTININDSAPTLTPPDAALVDDDDVAGAGGNPGGVGDDDPANTSGNLSVVGGDGDIDFFFSTVQPSLPAGFSHNLVDASTMQILQGATVILTITLNNETGAYSIVQNNPVDHSAGGDENNLGPLNVGLVAIDEGGTGDASNVVNLSITVDDDTPVATATLLTGTVDEDGVVEGAADNGPGDGIAGGTGDVPGQAVTATGNVSTLFSPGADQPLTFGFAANAIATLQALGLTSGGVALSYSILGDTVTASTPAGDVFTFQVQADGDYTFTLIDQLDHANGNAENDLSIALGGIIQATDFDGDPVIANANGLVITVDDDSPIATATQLTGTVDEDGVVENVAPGVQAGDGIAGGTGDVAGEVTVASGSVTTLFQSGADQPLTFGFAAGTVASLQALGLTSGGVALSYSILGDTVTAFTAAGNVFTFQLQANGNYTFTLIDQLDHPSLDGLTGDDTENDLAINLSSIIQATDFDGDSVGAGPNGLIITVDDDMPSIFDPEAIVAGELFNEAGSSATADLDVDANINNNVGADEPGLVQFANIANGDDSGFDSGGVDIEYWLSNNGQTLQGRVNSTNGTDGTLIFTVQLNQGLGTYTVTMAGEIDNGSGVSFNDLTSSAAGNVNFRGVGEDDPGTPVDLLLSASFGGAAATVNTDSDSIGAANQSMDQGETVRIDFVTNLTSGAATPTGFGYTGHVDTNSYLQTIPQVQGSQTETVAFQVYALDTSVTQGTEPDRNPAGGFADSSIVQVTKVTVDGFDVGETPVTVNIGAVGVWTAIAYGVFAQLQADGSVIFTGIQQGDQYGIETGLNDFNAIAVTSLPAGVGPNAANDSTTNSFDLGVFSIGQVDTGDPINLSFDLKLTDFDGDTVTVTDALAIQIDPPADALTLSVQSSSFAGDSSGGGDSFSNLSFSNDNGKWGGQGNDKSFSSINNTGIVAGMVAAAGLQSAAVAGAPTFEHSIDVGLQSSVATVGLPAYQLQSIDDGSLNVQSFGVESSAPAFDFSALQGSSHNFSDFVSDGGLDIQSYVDSAPAYQPNFQAGQAPTFDASMLVASVAPAVGMPSAEALIAADVAGVQQGGSVEQILADALGNQAPTVDGLLEAVNGGGQQAISPTIEAALHALPGGGGVGELSAILNGASPDVGVVSGWDMHSAGSFGAGFDMMFKMDVATLHQDAVQPAING